MRHLKKAWVRALVSLVGGGVTNEILFLTTGDPTRSRANEGSGITLIAAIVIFIFLTYFINKNTPTRVDKLK